MMEGDYKTSAIIEDGKVLKVSIEDGRIVQFDVLLSFDIEEMNKSYILYTDDSTDEFGQTQVFASVYESDGDGVLLTPVTTEKEWKILDIVLDEVVNEVRKTNLKINKPHDRKQ